MWFDEIKKKQDYILALAPMADPDLVPQYGTRLGKDKNNYAKKKQ